VRLGMTLGQFGPDIKIDIARIQEAERLGYDSVWTAEAWGNDAIVPLCWIGAQTQRIKLGTAIMQVPARTPAMAAMTAMTIDKLSGGRFVLGLGPSGPQVVEGWHGTPYARPLTRMREYITVIREILRREKRVEFQGEFYQLPYSGPDSTGLGKPLRSILHGRADLEIYTAAITPKGVALAAELADGFFPVWLDPEKFDLFRPYLEEGFKRAGGGKSIEQFDVAPVVPVILGADVSTCLRMVKPMLALYIGGMGARNKNFYNDYARRMGYEEAAEKIQTLFLDRKKAEAAAEVPDELADSISLCGPVERIRERVERWKCAPIGTMCIGSGQVEALRVMAEAVL